MFRTRDNFLDPRHFTRDPRQFTRDTRHAPIRLSRLINPLTKLMCNFKIATTLGGPTMGDSATNLKIVS